MKPPQLSLLWLPAKKAKNIGGFRENPGLSINPVNTNFMNNVKTNALPKMYDSWQEFRTFWYPWVASTGQRYLTITQYENGVINLYCIDWDFVENIVEKQSGKPKHICVSDRIRSAFCWLWRSIQFGGI